MELHGAGMLLQRRERDVRNRGKHGEEGRDMGGEERDEAKAGERQGGAAPGIEPRRERRHGLGRLENGEDDRGRGAGDALAWGGSGLGCFCGLEEKQRRPRDEVALVAGGACSGGAGDGGQGR